jgi:L-histidine Nalpha-methyltransferase
MLYSETDTYQTNRIKFTSFFNEIDPNQIRKELQAGLFAENRWISSKFFYDDLGSNFFEDITELEEYYPTRTEKSILNRIAAEKFGKFRNIDIVEFGSGDSGKISILFSNIHPENLSSIRYLPVDVSDLALNKSAEELRDKFEGVTIECLHADFLTQQRLIPHERKRYFCFFGSTIGNLEESSAKEFLHELNASMLPGDRLLIGFDLIKDHHILHAAYNDKLGVTADFNKNILNVVNGYLSCNFQMDDFDHLAFYNKDMARIEMHLVANRDVIINSILFEEPLNFRKGEHIHTENSHKYSLSKIREFAMETGFKVCEIYTDDKNWFALSEFEK